MSVEQNDTGQILPTLYIKSYLHPIHIYVYIIHNVFYYMTERIIIMIIIMLVP